MNFIKEFYKSCTSFKFYNSIKNKRFSKAVLYFLFILVIFSFIYGGLITHNLNASLNKVNDLGIQQFSIVDGNISFDGNLPYVKGDSDFTFILGNNQSLINFNEGVMINSTVLQYKRNNLSQYIPLTKNIDSNQIFSSNSLSIILLLGVFILMFVKLLFYVFVFAILGMLLNAFSPRNLRFKQLIIYGVYALTPLLTITVVLSLLVRFTIPFIEPLIYAIFLVGAVNNTFSE